MTQEQSDPVIDGVREVRRRISARSITILRGLWHTT